MNRRRDFITSSAALLAVACSPGGGGTDAGPSAMPPASPRLSARPQGVERSIAPGTIRLQVDQAEIVAYLPESALARPRVPLMLFLHGAMRTVEYFMDGFRPMADSTGVMVVMPYAARGTWDAIRGTFGADVAGIDAALAWAFRSVPVDPRSLALTGFSDGATYTLGLGRANGDLFTRLVAYAPGFLLPVSSVGRPPIVISHGTEDAVLSYRRTADNIVPALQQEGYAVDFRSFDGPHGVDGDVAFEQMQVLAAATAADDSVPCGRDHA
jgi:phospholipase/carboxylesterase